MTNKEYNELPKGEPKNINIGSRFRIKESVDSDRRPGSVVSYYEIIRITEHGFEFMEKMEKLTE